MSNVGYAAGIEQTGRLIAELDPVLEPGRLVFVSLPGGDFSDAVALRPLAAVQEKEGLTLVLHVADAEAAGLSFEGVFRMLLLRVHSSLDAVGLTAAVSAALAEEGIPANLLAGAFHDRVLVPEFRADDALRRLRELSGSFGSK